MELKITKEKVLEAASKCSTAKATLETLFPECFESHITYKNLETKLHAFIGKCNKDVKSLTYEEYNLLPGEYTKDKVDFIMGFIISKNL